mmetsp:Transcript_1280/g.3721  ORF Transcript_1280/g.3721 Transcript_1280/m.3721 type:complete len:271 (+) Transcript_1280:107-919(+)
MDVLYFCKASLGERELLRVLAGPGLQVVVELVGLVDDLEGEVLVKALVVVTELVLRLAVGHLVVAEPDQDLLELPWELPLDVVDVVHLVGLWVVHVDGDDLPVELAVVDHGVNSQDLDLVHATHLQLTGADLDHVHWVVVPRDLAVLVDVARVLPGLREQAVVPVDVVRVEPQVTLLDVLLDRGGLLVGRHLHLRGGLLRDLAHEVEGPLAALERDVVPRGHHLARRVLEEDPEVLTRHVSARLGLEGREQPERLLVVVLHVPATSPDGQ